jgi:predicted RNA binding protein YcfA (HicA-like mRNA interferase family)
VKLPRNISAERLIRTLERLGYHVVRQRGSHIRLKHEGPPAHLLSVPRHNSIKVGTLHAILSDVALMRSLPLESIVEML